MSDYINGDAVVIIRGPYSGLAGRVGGTREDGKVEVIFPDLSGPGREDEFMSPADLRLAD